MNEEEIIRVILDEAFYIHKTIGPGINGFENSASQAK